MVAEDDFPCINMSSASIPMCCTSSINITATFPTPTVTEAANSFCFALGRHGFRYPSISGDATCKSYVYCYLYAGRMRGQQYTCPGRTVFDCRTRACVVPTVPLQDCTFCNPQCFV
uniref:Chitin-binding type-2 domain-containing protein n=1 Tax=Megaselia scalaris TaxID=36166 RepID=T1H1S3_MEGSC